MLLPLLIRCHWSASMPSLYGAEPTAISESEGTYGVKLQSDAGESTLLNCTAFTSENAVSLEAAVLVSPSKVTSYHLWRLCLLATSSLPGAMTKTGLSDFTSTLSEKASTRELSPAAKASAASSVRHKTSEPSTQSEGVLTTLVNTAPSSAGSCESSCSCSVQEAAAKSTAIMSMDALLIEMDCIV